MNPTLRLLIGIIGLAALGITMILVARYEQNQFINQIEALSPSEMASGETADPMTVETEMAPLEPTSDEPE